MQDISFSSKGNVRQGYINSIYEHLSTCVLTGILQATLTNLFSLQKKTPISTSNQVSTNSVSVSCGFRRSLSSSNLLIKRFSSLFSDDEDETLVSDEELDPKKILSLSNM
ncbi:hypothetical protein Bca4012_061201 [Brassica carinata]